ncbi:MAG: nicotinamide mononucleotide transporter, partial [Candidatus Magasanikbacteria bacterium]|nr:nicotinamide mononucleotide transporter [Candidatus Magasanikbacteria bacterium]
MMYLLDINSVFFTIFQYPMSYIEFVGTVFTIACVVLTARAKVISWPVGIIGSVLYIFLFYQIQLYSDLFEQIYFLITGFMGWWAWTQAKKHIAQ